ncbi:MAG: nitroreductase family protein [Candidatus Onthomonas sp.]
MEALDLLFTRKSVRHFTDQPISEADLRTILLAGMSGPSCTNARDWSFLVVRERETLNKMAEINGPAASPLLGADTGILICGDLQRAFAKAPDYWIIDCAIAVENMHLAAHSLGIGSCWLGTYPQMNRVDGQRALFHLPDTVLPHSILALGYPAADAGTAGDPNLKWDATRIHREHW